MAHRQLHRTYHSPSTASTYLSDRFGDKISILAGGRGQTCPGQKLLMTTAERSALIAFMKTLSGNNVYTDERWSDPFDASGELTIIGDVLLGDANGDGLVNNQDIFPFAMALFNSGMYATMYPDINPDVVLDMNGMDGFNNQDIAGFATALGF